MKKSISLFLVVAMLLSLVPFTGFATSADAATRGGFTLVPTTVGRTGIDVSTSFRLTTPTEMTVEELAEVLSIDGQPQPEISAVAGSAVEFIVTPAVVLVSNTLYIFRITRDGQADVTWAFQTARRFQITSNFPANEAVNVPVRTGIEVTFSDEGYSPLDGFFSIYPNVAGTFQYHKNTAVFVPNNPLSYQTVYTVTIRSGIELAGTNEVLREDRVWSFETAERPVFNAPPPPPNPERVFFDTSYVELPTIQPPSVRYRMQFQWQQPRPTASVNVFRLDDVDIAVEAARRLSNAPRWSRHAREESFVDTSGLTSIMMFDTITQDDNRAWGTMMFPETLPQGFYLVEAVARDNRDQMIIQINDLPIQIISDDEQTIFWVNDIATASGLVGATVRDSVSGATYTTDEHGVAVINRAVEGGEDERIAVTARDGRVAVWMPTNIWGWSSWDSWGRPHTGNANEAYWTAFQLDRTLFQPDDRVFFWGFVECRRGSEEITHVSAVLRQGGWNRWSGTGRDVLHRQTVPVRNGVYSDEFMLPNVDTGSYVLTIYHGDIALGSMHFSVENFTKPPYQITASADRRAIFADESVTFTANASFFEGTPLPDLDISYRLFGWGGLSNSVNSQGRTNMDGEVTVTATPNPRADAQGETGLEFTVEATLPEIGWTMERETVRVFINDIDVRAQATRADVVPGRPARANISVDVNSITLDRINDGTSEHWNDFLDSPVAGQAISVGIYRQWWVSIPAGTWYCFIEKQTRTRYRWEVREERIQNFDISTNADGLAEREFVVPNRERESYFARISTVDGNGRTINQRIFIGRDWSDWFWRAERYDFYLHNDNELGICAVGDEVTLTVKRGTDMVERGNFLFVNMQRGIQSFEAGSNPYTFTFAPEHIPNIIVQAYYFNGFTYQSMSEHLRFDFEQHDLIITATTDKETYQPGDMISVTIRATDREGNPKSAAVNISLVDEALFALRDYNVNTLSALYRTVSSGLRFTASTHRTFVPSDATAEEMEQLWAPGGAGGGYDFAMEEMAVGAMAPMVFMDSDDSVAQRARLSYGAESASETHLREVFEDTAHFATVQTDANGVATHSFRLPDNITSWRMTLSGISSDLHAGNAVENVIVTMPMFLHYTLNDTFLTGDVPTLGVNVFGTELRGGETVTFEVWDEASPSDVRTASGAAFERINIPLWEMENEGASAIIIRATVSNGASDMVRHAFQVLRTYRQVDVAYRYDVTVDTVFAVGSGGLTNITFTDRGRAMYLSELIRLRNSWGDRVERMVVRREANRLLQTYFPDLQLSMHVDSFDARQYQQLDGGISILPHAESDLLTTVKLMPFIMDEINVGALRDYLYSIFEGENADNKMAALYGLAMLREPVLLDLQNYAMLEDLSIRDLTYIALGFYVLGEVYLAIELYDTRIAPYLERIAPYVRVNIGVDNDDILEATSAVLLLAQKLDRPEMDGLYLYLVRNRPIDILTNLERLSFIQLQLGRATAVTGSITYTLFGETVTRDLSRSAWGWGGTFTLRIPAQNMHEFRLVEVSGDVGAVSTFRQPMSEVSEFDHEITVRRRFYRIGDVTDGGNDGYIWEFEQGDIIRVNLWIDYSDKAIQGSFVVTDFLPSGLEFIPDSARIPGSARFGIGHLRHARVEGQRVMFFDHNRTFNHGILYYYYARVISPGTFRAEGTLVQNLNAPSYFTVGQDDVVVIR